MSEIDEEALNRQPEGAEVSEPAPEFPVKLGRPKGLPKTGGRRKETARSVAVAAAPHIVKHLAKIAAGERVKTSGPTGKEIYAAASLSEKLRAAEIITQLVVEPPPPEPKAPVEDAPEPPAVEDVRKALLDALGVPPVIEAPEPQVDPTDGGVVTHITDPEAIKAFDRQLANPKKPVNSNSKTFENGFGWERRHDAATRKDVFDLYNPQGLLCGHRRSQERADSWCENGGAAI
jgi:hypothetical protein